MPGATAVAKCVGERALRHTLNAIGFVKTEQLILVGENLGKGRERRLVSLLACDLVPPAL